MNNTNSSKKGIVWAIVIAVVVIIVGIVYFKMTPQTEMKSDQTSATSTYATNVKGFSDSVTYTDAKYGYAFTYTPTGPGFKLLSDLTQDQRTEFASYMGACTDGRDLYKNPTSVVLCYIGNNISKEHNFDAASFVVTPATSTTMAACNAPDSWARKSHQVVVNGTQYLEEWGGDAGLSHHLAINTYKTYHNGICYSIDLNIESHASNDDGESSPIFKNLTDDVMSQMQVILKTFTFTSTKAVSDGADCPVSMTVTSPNGGETYKAGDTVHVTWSDTGITDQYLTLNVLDESGTNSPFSPASHRLTQLDNTSHEFVWTIPAQMPAGKYKISIDSVGKGDSCDLPSDQSDNYFTITN